MPTDNPLPALTRRTLLTGAVVLVGSAAVGCGTETTVPGGPAQGGPAGIYPVTVEGLEGSAVMLGERPQRVVDLTLVGYRHLLALGYVALATPAIGVQPFVGSRVAELGGTPPVTDIYGAGGFTADSLNVEAVAALAPDLILVPKDDYRVDPAVREDLARIAPILIIPTTEDGTWRAGTRLLAAVLGDPARAETVIADTESRLDAVFAGLDVSDITFAYNYYYDDLAVVCDDPTFAPVEILLATGLTMTPSVQALDDGCSELSLELVGQTLADTDVLILPFLAGEREAWLANEAAQAVAPVVAGNYLTIDGDEPASALDGFSPTSLTVVIPLLEDLREVLEPLAAA